MKKLNMNKYELLTAVKKASVAFKDSFILSVMDKLVDPAGEIRQGALICSDGCNQAVIYVGVRCEADSCGQYIFGKLFQNIVETFASVKGDTITIALVKDGSATMSCGNATVPVPMLDAGVQIEAKDPTKTKTARIVMSAELFKAAMQKSGKTFAMDLSGTYEALANAIELKAVKLENKFYLRIVTSDSFRASGTRVAILQQDGLDALIEEKISLSVNATVLGRISSELSSDMVGMFLMKEQLIVQDGNDVYLITPNALAYPGQIGDMLEAKPQVSYQFKAKKNVLLNAVEVAMLGSSEGVKARIVCDISDGKLHITSPDGANRMEVEAEDIKGNIRFGLGGDLFRKLLSKTGECVELSGEGMLRPVYLEDGDVVTYSRNFMAPCSAESNEEAETGEDVE